MLKTVATFTNPIEAHIVRGRLECEDIAAFVAHEHHIWAKWSLSHALGGVKIQVAPSNSEKALAVICDINSGKFIDSLEGFALDGDYAICGQCNSDQAVYLSWSWKFSLISIFIFMLPFPYTTNLVKCGTCGHTWINSQQRFYPLTSLGIVLIALSIGLWLFVTSAFYLCKVNYWSNICI